MLSSADFAKMKIIKSGLQTTCNAAIIVAFSSMSALAFDGSTQAECYDYVVAGCNEDPPCTLKETNALLDSCDEYPAKTNTSRPSFSAKPPTAKVAKSAKYKKKIRRLRADIRRKKS